MNKVKDLREFDKDEIVIVPPMSSGSPWDLLPMERLENFHNKASKRHP